MVGSTRSVQLSTAQVTYLLDTSYLASDLRDIVAAALTSAPTSGKTTFEVDADVAERFRSTFTERLAQVGFDRDYEPTDEGAMLEDLIDVFSGTA